MTLAEREELRRVGREHNATAGLVCPADVKAAFNFEFDDIDIDVPMGELLVEASKDTPRWRVMLTPLPGAHNAGLCPPSEPDEPVHALAWRQGYLVQPRWPVAPGIIQASSENLEGWSACFSLPGPCSCCSARG